ncbi:helix-turn-helix domain-containing protein, partial [Vibrio breoganii]|uniref:helix-turn-helix domain-containing protein n=1 Tax=Vibrio breoganii TaxID=553239 RepID=UPI001F5391B3
MNYQPLTEGRRYQISALLEQVVSVSEIAKTVKCHLSTIYRELKRSGKKEQYAPDKAHQVSVTNRHSAPN